MDADAALKRALWGHFQSESFAPNDSRVMTKRLSEHGLRSIFRHIAAALREVPDIRGAPPPDHSPALDFVLAVRAAVQHRYPSVDAAAVQPSQLLTICSSESFHTKCWAEMAMGKSVSSTNWTTFCSAVADQLANAIRSLDASTSRGNPQPSGERQPVAWRQAHQLQHPTDLEASRGAGKPTTPNKSSRALSRKQPILAEGPRSSPGGSPSKQRASFHYGLDDEKCDSVIELALSPLQPAGEADEASPRITGVVRVVPRSAAAAVPTGVHPSAAQDPAATGTPSLVARGPAATRTPNHVEEGRRTAVVTPSSCTPPTAAQPHTPHARDVRSCFGSTFTGGERAHGAPVFMPAPTHTQPTPSSPPRRSRQRTVHCDPRGTPPSHHLGKGAGSLTRLRGEESSAARGAPGGTCRELLIGGWSPPAPAVHSREQALWCPPHAVCAARRSSWDSLGSQRLCASSAYHARYDWGTNQELRRHLHNAWPDAGQHHSDTADDDATFDGNSPFGLMPIGDPDSSVEDNVFSPTVTVEPRRQHRYQGLDSHPHQPSWYGGSRTSEDCFVRVPATTSQVPVAFRGPVLGASSGESLAHSSSRVQNRWSDIGYGDTSGTLGSEATQRVAEHAQSNTSTKPIVALAPSTLEGRPHGGGALSAGFFDTAIAPACAPPLVEPMRPPWRDAPAAVPEASHVEQGSHALYSGGGLDKGRSPTLATANSVPSSAAPGPSCGTAVESMPASKAAVSRARCPGSAVPFSLLSERVPLQTIPLQQLFPAAAEAAPAALAASSDENAVESKTAPPSAPVTAPPRSPASVSSPAVAAIHRPLKLPTTRPKMKPQ